jgi:hypothetical protein
LSPDKIGTADPRLAGGQEPPAENP